MLLAIVIVLILGIIYMHVLQGFFSAALSAVYAVIAAAVALGYTDSLVAAWNPAGGMADYATGLAMVALFAATYIVLRVVSDKVVPGNIRLNVWVDRAGGGAMGLVAAIFAMGTLLVAAQALPFGPSIAGYSRYTLKNIDQRFGVAVSPTQQVDAVMNDYMTDANWPDKPESSLWVDDWVVNTVSGLSENAMSADRPMRAIHPDYLRELSGLRVGVEPSARHNLTDAVVSVETPFLINQAAVKDAELPDVRAKEGDAATAPDNDQAVVKQGTVLLVVPVKFDPQAEDKDTDLVRLTCAAVRMVAGTQGQINDYFPIGTFEPARRTIFRNHIDDPIYVRTHEAETPQKKKDLAVDGHAYFVFEVPEGQLLSATLPKPVLVSDVFIDVKGLARFPLPAPTWTPGANLPVSTVLHKEKETAVASSGTHSPATPGETPTPTPNRTGPHTPPPPVQPALPVKVASAVYSNTLPAPVTIDSDAPNATRFDTNVVASLQDRKFDSLLVHSAEPVPTAGAKTVDQIFSSAAPPLQVTVQITGGDPWDVAANVGTFKVQSTGVTPRQPIGVFIKVKKPDGSAGYIMIYHANGGVDRVDKEPGTFQELVLVFEHDPKDPPSFSLTYKGQPAGEVKP